MQTQQVTQQCRQDNHRGGMSPRTGLRPDRIPFWLLALAIVVSTGVMTAVCLHSQCYLGSNDAFYYLSIADNWLQNGVFLDGTTVPNGPITTPQNGIVGIFCMLRMLSLTTHQCLLAVLGLNYVLLLSCFYPLFRLCRIAGIESRAMLACILLVFVGSLRIFMWVYMAPINDMLFYTGQLWLLYMLSLVFQRQGADGPKSAAYYLLCAGAVALAAVLIHFRFNVIIVPLGGIAAAVITRKLRTLPLMVLMLAGAVLSLALSWLVVDRYDFQANTTGTALLMGDFSNQMFVLLFRLIPESLFRDLRQAGNLLYLPFYAALLLAFIQGAKQKNIVLLLVVFICLGTMAMTALHGNITERYLWAVTAFMYILLLRVKPFRAIGVLFVTAVLINSLWSPAYRPPRVDDWKMLAARVPISRENPFVLTYYHREFWYYMQMPSVNRNDYTWARMADCPFAYILGPRQFIDEHIENMRQLAKAASGEIHVRPIDYGAARDDMLLVEVTIAAVQDNVPPAEPTGTENSS